MTFEIHSKITNRTMTVAARAMRRVLRRKRSIIWAIFGWSVFLFSALLLIPFDGEPFALDVRTVTSLLVEVMLLSVLLFQDRFKGMIARKNTPWRARCKILCKRFSTKSRMALESRADSGLNPLITESHGGQSGMRAGTA